MSDKFYPSPNLLLRWLAYAWSSPNSLLGLTIGLVGLMTGGRAERHRGCLEFHGGFVNFFLKRIGGGAAAMTLGHTILGISSSALDIVRDHEQVHVRQYERWGPIFIPAYCASSMIAWLSGKRAYLDNAFEIEAYQLSDPHRSRSESRPSGD